MTTEATTTTDPTPAAVIAAIRARGSDAVELRDGAHEACHALELGLVEWDRDTIHFAIMRRRIGDRIAMECTARAVEQVVCARLGVTTDSVDKWAFITAMEAASNGLLVPPAVIVTGVNARMNAPETLRLVDAILALPSEASTAPKPVRKTKRTRSAKVKP